MPLVPLSAVPTYNVSTFAGLVNTAGLVDGLGSAARFIGPGFMCLDASGMLYVVDEGNHVRNMTSTGLVRTLFATGGARDVAVDAAGNVYYTTAGFYSSVMVFNATTRVAAALMSGNGAGCFTGFFGGGMPFCWQ